MKLDNINNINDIFKYIDKEQDEKNIMKNIEEIIKKVINYFKIETYKDDNYNIYQYDYEMIYYYEPMEYKNFVIKFDECFKKYDITKTIKEGLDNLKDFDDIFTKTEIKIIEKKRNNEYVFIYNINPFECNGLFYNYVKEYYKEIIKLLIFIFDIKNYKYSFELKEYNDNQYKILNNDYIIVNYKDYEQTILMKILDDYNNCYNYMNNIKCNYEIIYFLNNNIFCFINNKTKNNFENYLNKYLNDYINK